MVKVKFFTTLRKITNTKEIVIDLEGSVADILEILIHWKQDLGTAIYDETGLYVIIFLNGRDIEYIDGLETRVNGDDTLHLFPPIAGGCGEPIKSGQLC